MLTDIPTFKTYIGVTDSVQDTLFQKLVPAADEIVKRYCKRDLETNFYTGPSAEYRDGNGYKDLPLWQRPLNLSPPGLTGTITKNSPTITALSLNPQTYLSVGMPVQVIGPAAQSAQGAFPPGATITSIDSTTQVTCTANSTANGSNVGLIFGLRVYLDPGGFYG